MTPFAQVVLAASLRILAVALGVALILAAARVRSGSLRHAAWTAVLGAMLLMPVLPYVVPRVSITVPLREEPASTVEDPAVPAAVVQAEMPRPSVAEPPAPLMAVEAQPPSRWTWPVLMAAIYAMGVVLLLVRLVFGWFSAQRLVQAARVVPELCGKGRVYESPGIAVPLTIGLLAPRITLPVTWREWPVNKLAAVLAHEQAHVDRRDSVVSLLAHVNRCLFWFHPLAWWLERKLAATAEHACDDAGIRAMGEPRRYAELLLELAGTVQRSGGRYAWQGIGMDGTGLLGQRIDRILRGGFTGKVSRGRKVLVALSCAAAIILVAGCRQQAKVAELADSPETLERRAARQAREARNKAVEAMTAEQADAAEASLQSNPEDLETRKKLLSFYFRRGWQVIGMEKTVMRRRGQILWFIEHHPLEDDSYGAISPFPGDQLADPEGYAQARKLWLEQAGAPGATAAMLGAAADFVRIADQTEAERLYQRARELDPKGHWSARLGQAVYFPALVGSHALMPEGVVRAVRLAAVHGAFAEGVRKKLAETTDAKLLAATGQMLVIQGSRLYEHHDLDFDAGALGKTYLERALELDPQSITAHQGLVMVGLIRRARVEDPAKLSEAQRFPALARAAETAYLQGEAHDRRDDPATAGRFQRPAAYRYDPAAAKASREQARTYAQQSLELAARFRDDPNYGDAIYTANTTLGLVAMHEGKRKAAVAYMLEASKAPQTERLAYSHQYGTFALSAWLLKDGERESVLEFLERFAQTDVSEKAYLLASAALIREGKKPLWYAAVTSGI